MASPASNDDLDQSISHLCVSPFLYPAAALSQRDTENQGASASGPLGRRTYEEGYFFFNRWAEEESAAADSSAGPFSGNHSFVPSGETAPGQDGAKLTKGYPNNFNYGSHRRSVSSVTL